MAGEPAEPVASAGSAASATEPAASASSPAAAAPAAAAAPEPVSAPAAAVQPEPVPAAAPAVVEPAAPAAPAAEPTLLQKHDAEVAAAAKPAEPAKSADPAKPAVAAAEPEKPADPAAAPAAEPAAPALDPVEYTYELPETIKLDDATKTSFHTALDAFRQDPAKGAQGLIDLHNQTMTQYAEHVANEQMRVWNETRKGWQTQVMADEQLGGAGFQTTMGAVARMRDLLVPEASRAAFDQFLSTTGAGDHPEFLRLLHNAARLYDEAPLPPPDPRPAPNGGQRPSGRLRDMYKSNQRG